MLSSIPPPEDARPDRSRARKKPREDNETRQDNLDETTAEHDNKSHKIHADSEPTNPRLDNCKRG